MNLVDVLALGVGGILIYSAVKDDNPVTVIKDALSGKAPGTPKDGTTTSGGVPPGKQIVGGAPGSPGTTTSNGGIGPGTSVSYEPPVIPSPTFVSV